MAIAIASKVQKLRPSPSIAAKQRVSDLRAQGRHIFDFCMGEPDFDTPQPIIDAAVAAMTGGETHYTGTQGIAPLRTAIAEKLERENGVVYTPSEIVVGNGAKQLIFEVFSATLSEGDEVIVPAPFWVSYPDIVTLNGGKPVIVPCGPETSFKLTAEALEKAITPKTRWLIMNSPGNPTGALYSKSEWEALIEVLNAHPDVALMTDEIYEHITYDGARNLTPVSLSPELRERCVIVNGVSKAYAMTGWRIGYAAGPDHVIKAVVKLLGQSTTCACSFSQFGAMAALEGDQMPVAEMVEAYKERRHCIVTGLNATPGIECAVPDAAFYVFPDVRGLLGSTTPEARTLTTDLDIVDYLLEEASAAVMDGTSYGMPGFLRLSFATSTDTIEQGTAAIQAAVNRLKIARKPA